MSGTELEALNSSTSIPYAGNVQFDAEQAGAGRDVERLAVFVAPGYVAHALGIADHPP